MMERAIEGKEEDLLKRERVIAFLRLKIPDVRDSNNNNNNDVIDLFIDICFYLDINSHSCW